MIYAVPARNVEAFVAFLRGHAFPLADGSFVAPAHFRPGSPEVRKTLPPVGDSLRGVLDACHLIAPNVVGPDHPAAMVARMRNRDLLASGRRW